MDERRGRGRGGKDEVVGGWTSDEAIEPRRSFSNRAKIHTATLLGVGGNVSWLDGRRRCDEGAGWVFEPPDRQARMMKMEEAIDRLVVVVCPLLCVHLPPA